MTTTDPFIQASNAFITWLTSIPNTTLSPGIAIADFRTRNAGRGIVATRDIQAGETLFTIPPAAILSTSTARLPALLPDVFREGEQGLDPLFALTLCLLYEQAHAESSFWAPYLAILPSSLNTLMFWSETELEELQGSAVRHKIGREDADAAFRETLLPLLRANVHLFKTEKSSDDALLTQCHVAASTIMAYAFDLSATASSPSPSNSPASDDETSTLRTTSSTSHSRPKALIPLADTLNSTHPPNAHLEQAAALGMVSTAFIPAGQEVMNTYGELPTSGVLRQYGYADPGFREFDVVEVSLDLVLRIAGGESERVEYAETRGLVEDAYDFGRADSSSSTIPPDLVTLLSILLSNTASYKKAHKTPLSSNPALHTQVYTTLEAILLARSADYATTLEQDRELAGRGATGRYAMALAVRMGEKEVLQDALGEVRGVLLDVKGLDPNGDGRERKRVRVR